MTTRVIKESVIKGKKGSLIKDKKCCNGHCVKSVPIQSYSCPYSVQMPENADQNSYDTDTFYSLCNLQSCGKMEIKNGY